MVTTGDVIVYLEITEVSNEIPQTIATISIAPAEKPKVSGTYTGLIVLEIGIE